MNELNNKLDTAKDRLCKLENSYDEITQNAAQRNKWIQNTKEIPSTKWKDLTYGALGSYRQSKQNEGQI